MKPTLITMIPILLIFGWMSSAIAFEPIFPGESFVVTADFAKGISGDAAIDLQDGLALASSEEIQQISEGKASWRLRAAEAGTYSLDVVLDSGTDAEIRESRDVLITTDLDYEEQIALFPNSDIEQIVIEYEKLRPLGSFKLFGWQPGWLAIYIICSLVFSLSLRRLFDLH